MTTVKHYRETNTGDKYTIEYRKRFFGKFDIYCTEHPTNPHNTAVTKCHLYGSGQVCVAAGREPKTLDRAIAIAMVWMQGYSQYIRTGTFPTGKKRVNV